VKRPQLKSPRLLPIVIFAACALLLFKAVGLLTDGGYVLTGTQAAVASEAAAPAAGAPAAGDAAEPTMADSSPTLSDTAPTLANLELPDPSAAEKSGMAAPKEGQAAAGEQKAPAGAPGAKDTAAATPLPPCPPGAPALTAEAAIATCMPADAQPMKADQTGKAVPIATADGDQPSGPALLQRLADRRAELDKREQALNLREAVIAAAEKQMTQRADELKALQSQIAALTQQKTSMEDEQFSGIVKMYEAMKPQEAASIFDGLDMNVLLRVAKAMDPRKMSPILAKMAATRAQQLTVQIAAGDPQTVASVAPVADPNGLPQIVGH